MQWPLSFIQYCVAYVAFEMIVNILKITMRPQPGWSKLILLALLSSGVIAEEYIKKAIRFVFLL